MNDNNDANGFPPIPGGPGDSGNAPNVSRPFDFLLDIPLELTVEVGRRSMTMGELLELLPGSIVELDRPAGDQLDILANGKLVARGEAVVVGDRYGIRILEIINEGGSHPGASEGGAF